MAGIDPHENPPTRVGGREPKAVSRRLAFRGKEVVLDGAMVAGWTGTVSLDPALEREFDERLGDSSALAFRVALSVLRRREDAEDVAQEAFLRAHRSFASIRDRDRFRAWLVRTAFRIALDRIRGEKRRARREDAVALLARVHEDSAEEHVVRGELQARVAEAVAALPEKLRLVTVLVAIEEQDLASVARLLELPEGTVKSRLHRARKELAERLRWLASNTATR
jgi:RNA polymerase sigma-70 factor (ECF subfamily)